MQKAGPNIAMSLVANYSDSDSDASDNETVDTNTKPVDHISDEEDFQHSLSNGPQDFLDDEAEQDVFSIISQLPVAKIKATESTYVDESEVNV